MTVSFHRLALRELRRALAWYRQRDRNVAIRFQTAVENAVDRMAADPESLPIEHRQARRIRVRRFPYRFIFESLGDDRIFVIAVAHDRRRSGYWRRRM